MCEIQQLDIVVCLSETADPAIRRAISSPGAFLAFIAFQILLNAKNIWEVSLMWVFAFLASLCFPDGWLQYFFFWNCFGN
jgi:hypothetical protein